MNIWINVSLICFMLVVVGILFKILFKMTNKHTSSSVAKRLSMSHLNALEEIKEDLWIKKTGGLTNAYRKPE